MSLPPYTRPQSSAGGGAATWPFEIVQEAIWSNAETSSYPASVLNFSKAATAGNTLLLMVASDYRDTVQTPAGYTRIGNVSYSPYCQASVFRKTAAGGEASVTFQSATTSTPPVCYFLEIQGTHVLDQIATATALVTSNNEINFSFPTLTPSNETMIFCVASLTQGASNGPPPPYATKFSWNMTALNAFEYRGGLFGVFVGEGSGSALPAPQGAYSVGPIGLPDGCAITFSLL